jgi:hypothetical protein
MSEQRVWIAQCLCPQRHCIMALAGESDSKEAATNIAWALREQIDEVLRTGLMNPWCGLCKAPEEDWRYEVGRTPFSTMEEAAPVLRKNEAEQAATRAAWGDMKRSD